MSTISSNCTVHIVPTKTDDNCSYASIWKRNDLIHAQEHVKDETKFDAFQHYSNDLNRLKTLLLSPDQQDDNDQDESSALIAVNNALRSVGLSDLTLSLPQAKENKMGSKRRRGNSSRPIKDGHYHDQRKTRLSWEIHPSLLLYDLFDELEENVHSVSDEGDMMQLPVLSSQSKVCR